MYYKKKLMAIAALTVLASQVQAAPTAEEVKQLGTTLTPFGSEKAANADGSIPAWTGGLCTPPADYKPTKGAGGGGPYIDVYAAEKPLFRITAANLAQYADKVDEGTKELFKRYPTFAMDVYPTHRTVCYPNWVYENTVKRVMNPKLVGAAPGLAGAHAQIPFPLPKTGYEVMWNGLVKFGATNLVGAVDSGLVDAAGNLTRTSFQYIEENVPYWDNTLTSLPDNQSYWNLIATTKYPASLVGVKQLRVQFLRADIADGKAWSYVPGQRRVRLSPEFKYDTVSTTSGGVLIFDEIYGFDGKMDKFDFKLVGKKEMYVPYNALKLMNAPLGDALKKGHANPDLMRWELHRTWVVEATLKATERHIQKKKVFFVDEDSWVPVLYNSFDQAGKIHHLMHLPTFQEYDKPGPRNGSLMVYDMTRGIYNYSGKPQGPNAENTGWVKVDPFPANYFTPDALAGSGVR